MVISTIDNRHQYYAAGILWWVEKQSKSYFTLRDLSVWQFPNFEDDPSWFKPVLANTTLATVAIQLLEELGAIKVVKDTYGPTSFEVVGLPLAAIAEASPDTPFDRVSKFGGQWIEDAISSINEIASDVSGDQKEETPFSETTPATDVWEPLRLERSNQSFAETIEGVEKSIREIAADNGFSSAYPDERDNLISHANATLESAKEGKVTKRQIREHFIAAGKWIAKKFVGTSIGALGVELAKLGLKLLGFIP